ncbi:hypothetical protein SDC9_55147 [bioreactor metagenome]|uniref:Uncharacterized protein n=1 Tax=bioreactor metagenome TaxID=1076179 RepID=A0A644WZ11_9ZZZZ
MAASDCEGGQIVVPGLPFAVPFPDLGHVGGTVLLHGNFVDEGVPPDVRVLLQHGEEVGEGLDGGPRGPEIGLADLLRAVGEEGRQGLVGNEIFRRVSGGVDVPDVPQEDIELFRGQAAEVEDGGVVVGHPGRLREGVLVETGLDGLVAVEPLPGIVEEIGRSAQEEPHGLGGALEAVVEHPEDLFVVGEPGLGTGQLVEVHHLVEVHQQAAVARLPDEEAEDLEGVVDVGVVDDGAHAQGVPGVGAGGELAPEPPYGVRPEGVVAPFVAVPVGFDDRGEIVPAHELGDFLQPAVDGGGHGLSLRFRLFPRLGEKTLHETGKASPVGLRPGGEVAGQLGVEVPGLPSRGIEPAVRGKVAVESHQALFQGDGPDELEEEALARAVGPDDELEGRPAVEDAVQVLQQGLHFPRPADLDVVEPRAGRHARPEGLENGVPLTGPDFRLSAVHGKEPPLPGIGQ